MGKPHGDVRMRDAERADQRRDRFRGERRQGDEVERARHQPSNCIDLDADVLHGTQRQACRFRERRA